MNRFWQTIKKRINAVKAGFAWKSIRWKALFLTKWRLMRLGKTTFIGITGSAGKTTTKDLTTGILSNFSSCNSTVLSFGEVSGIAETIKNTSPEHKYCVIEMHGGGPNEMTWALRFIRPSIAVVTVVAREHYSAFENLGGIADEKSKLIASLPSHGVAVLNIDDPLVRQMGEKTKARVIWVGKNQNATLRLIKASSNWPDPLKLKISYNGEIFDVTTKMHGVHLSLPVLSAIGVALALKLPLKQISTHLKELLPSLGRMQIVKGSDGVTFIRDDFKAPHWSIEAPFDFLKTAKAARKVAIIGSISDSPKNLSERYIDVVKRVRNSADLIVLIGISTLKALKLRTSNEDKSIQAFISIEQASKFLKKELRPGDLVLLKGNNKTDHLIRLIIDRTKDVKCWKDMGNCKLGIMCDKCSFLFKPDNKRELKSQELEYKISNDIKNGDIPVIIGLGNPGEKFDNTPHNAGFRLIDSLISSTESIWNEGEDGRYVISYLEKNPFILFKPNTFMNESGKPIKKFLSLLGIDISRILLVHDDMDLPLGKIRHRTRGSDGGHKGIRSVIYNLGTDEFHRLKIGVSSGPTIGANKTDVINTMNKKRLDRLDESINEAILLTREFIFAQGKPTENLMNMASKKRFKERA